MKNRRDLLVGLAAAGMIGTAGCTETSVSETIQNLGADDGPEAVVEDYVRATAEGDVDTQEELLHEDSEKSPESDSLGELTIHEIHEATVEERIEQEGFEDEEFIEQAAEEVEAIIQETVEEVEADNYVLVFYQIETAEIDEDERFLLLVDVGDDDWKILEEI